MSMYIYIYIYKYVFITLSYIYIYITYRYISQVVSELRGPGSGQNFQLLGQKAWSPLELRRTRSTVITDHHEIGGFHMGRSIQLWPWLSVISTNKTPFIECIIV